MNEAIDRLRLARCEGVGPVTYRRLLGRYGSAAAALDALPGIAREAGRATPLAIPTRAKAAREIEGVERIGGRLLFLDQPDYPALLALLADAPPAIAVLGRIDLLASRAVAIVGSRNASTNGQRIAGDLSAGLAGAELAVVSGLARGIDAAAHRGALAAGLTIACIAGGLDKPYPPENVALQAEIAERGAVVAEAPLGTAPQARHFPRRNRIIAGLSLGVVIVEAAPRSGSLITARLAGEYHRELFAVPGSPLDARARGANDLIRQGAHLTETVSDILDNLPDHPLRSGVARLPLFARGDAPEGLSEDAPDWTLAGNPAGADQREVHGAVLDLLGTAPTSVDDVIRRCQFSAAAIVSALLDLELAGRIESVPGNRVALLANPEIG